LVKRDRVKRGKPPWTRCRRWLEPAMDGHSRWPKRPSTSSIINPGPVCKAARLAFSGAKSHLKAYTRRKRKETLDEIMKLARTINETLAPTTPRHARAASRLAVETRLQRHGVFTTCQNTKVSPSFQLTNSHK